MMILTIFCLLSCCLLSNAQVKLSSYNIDKSSITASGISSGGAMASQLHVAFSNTIVGHGTIAGPPYWCAQGQVMYATSSCMSGLGLTVATSTLINKANSYSNAGSIDPLSNLKNHRVYIYSGSKDTTVASSVVKKGEDFFKNYMDASRIKTVYNIASVHGHITENYGSACGTTDKSYINNCDYHQAYDLMTHLYPNDNLVRPSKNHVVTGDLFKFDQKEFYPSGVTTSALSMETYGWVYVPTNCLTQQCKLHIALHGCLQAAKNIADVYVKNAGYNQVADVNNIIILYPQATSNLLANPNACWDWWGYVNANYAIRSGPQMTAIRSMITRLASA